MATSSAPTDPCVHCGFCLPSCASYRVLGTEMDSPRGRIHALKAIDAGELSLDTTLASHFDSCLGCFACVTACPSGVRYDQLLEATRPKLNAPELRSPRQKALRSLLFALLPYPRRLRALLRPLGRGPWRGLAKLLGPELAAMDALLPPLQPESFRDDHPVVVPAQGPRRYRVGLLLGCVQRVFDPAVNAAALRVLSANGIEVVIPPQQGCCGAVTHHQGEEAQTRQLAAALIDSFAAVIGPGKAAGPEPLDAVLATASGCGHTLKAYGRLLQNPAAERFGAQVRDIQEFLQEVGLREDFAEALQPLRHADGSPAQPEAPLVVAYHDACHMLHGQGLAEQPRALLRSIPHLQIREATEAGVCCGSAGIYNLVQPEEAAALGRLKADDLSRTGAEIAVSANIGCSLQIRHHLQQTSRALPVEHPIQLLDRSHQGG
jgi:glycolate oxidase iron-sulfur subunit